MSEVFRVTAIMSSFNEGDIISPVIEHLIENGIQVYLIDNRSTDDTVEQAKRWLGKGLLEIEQFPTDSGNGGDAREAEFDWSAILRRKEELAESLESDWFIHHDADEFREAPWPGMTLRDAIQWVDALDYNCIGFRVFNFPPVDDSYEPGADPKAYFHYCKEAEIYDRLQLKCWKKTDSPVSLTPSGGHEAAFANRRVFPISFLMRHYPIRSEKHGRRKVFEERLPRFSQTERQMGWHVQYDAITAGETPLLADSSKLQSYDSEQLRLETLLKSDPWIELDQKLKETETQLADREREHNRALQEIEALAQRVATMEESLERERRSRADEVLALEKATEILEAEKARLTEEIAALRAQLDYMTGSASWRWTAPLRWLRRAVSGARRRADPAGSTRDRRVSARSSRPSAKEGTEDQRLSFVLPVATDGTGRDDQDVHRARLLLQSLERFLERKSLGDFLIVTPDADVRTVNESLKPWLSRLGVNVVRETEVCPELLSDPDTTETGPRPNKGWYRQQLIKLAAHEHVSTPFYLTLDADVIFTRPFSARTLIQDGRASLNIQTEEDFRRIYRPEMAAKSVHLRRERYQQVEPILGCSRDPRYRDRWYGETPMLLNRDLVGSLARRIETRSGRPWRTGLLEQLPWTEQPLYFVHLEDAGLLEANYATGDADTVLRLSDSLWEPADEYLEPRSLDNWNVEEVFRRDAPGIAVVVHSYLGYEPEDVAEKVRPFIQP